MHSDIPPCPYTPSPVAFLIVHLLSMVAELLAYFGFFLHACANKSQRSFSLNTTSACWGFSKFNPSAYGKAILCEFTVHVRPLSCAHFEHNPVSTHGLPQWGIVWHTLAGAHVLFICSYWKRVALTPWVGRWDHKTCYHN